MKKITQINKQEQTYSEDGLYRLKQAILMSAVADYRQYCKQLKRHKKNPAIVSYAREMRLIIKFIMSDWFKTLTDDKVPQKECALKLISEAPERTQKYLLKEVNKYNDI